jgi:hypothetical protein
MLFSVLTKRGLNGADASRTFYGGGLREAGCPWPNSVSRVYQPHNQQRRRRKGCEPLPPLPPVQEGHFPEVKGVLLLPAERVETSPGRHSVVRRFLVSCLGNADGIFRHLYAQLRELGWERFLIQE